MCTESKPLVRGCVPMRRTQRLKEQQVEGKVASLAIFLPVSHRGLGDSLPASPGSAG